MLPLLALPTDGLLGTRKVAEDEDEVTEEVWKLFGDHAPLLTKLPGMICGKFELDLKVMALSLWTSNATYQLVTGYAQLARDCEDMKEMEDFCSSFLDKQRYEDLEKVALVPLFFAPMGVALEERAGNTQRPVTLREMLGEFAREFYELGCAYLTAVGAEACDLTTGIFCTQQTAKSMNPIDFEDTQPVKKLPTFEQSLLDFRQLPEVYDVGTVVKAVRTSNQLWREDEYVKIAAKYMGPLLADKRREERNKLIVASTAAITRTIASLWLPVPSAAGVKSAVAGPVFRGDYSPQDWLRAYTSSDQFANWPVATSYRPSVALEAFKRHTSEYEQTEDSPVGRTFAILVAEGVRCIDIYRRLSDKTRGGGWLNCYADEQEVLLHPETVFIEVGDVYNVGDVRRVPPSAVPFSQLDPLWARAIHRIFRDRGMRLPDLSGFRNRLLAKSGTDAKLFEQFQLAVAFSASRGGERPAPEATRKK